MPPFLTRLSGYPPPEPLTRHAMPRVPPESPDGSEAEAEEDELDELPPIDGERGDDPESAQGVEEIDDAGAIEGSAEGLDDSTGEDDPVGDAELEGDEAEGGWLDEAADSAELDVGDAVLVDGGEENASLEDGDEPPSTDEDFGVGEGAERVSLDFAEEGPVDPDEELREEDLPALDADDGADDEGKAEDDPLLDERVAGEEPLGLPWAQDPWARVGSPLALAGLGLSGGITAIACAARGALVAGRSDSGAPGLVRVDLEGARQILPAEGLNGGRIAALAAEGESVAVVTEGGRLFLSQDGGTRFEAAVVPEGVSAADVALASGFLWVRTRTGSLLAARPGKVLERRVVPGPVVAFAGDGSGGVLGLAADETGRPATLVRGQIDGTVACEAVQAPAGRPGAVLTARGDHLAYIVASPRGGIVFRSRDGSWQRLAWEGRVTALALIDAGGTLVAAMYSESDDTTGLVRLDAAGRASIVARLGASRDDADADGRALAIACDDPRGVVWVAGGFGVAAFATK